jgi:hypothetical protein
MAYVHRVVLRIEHNFSETGSIFFFKWKYAETCTKLRPVERALPNHFLSGIICMDVLVPSLPKKGSKSRDSECCVLSDILVDERSAETT